MDKSFELRDTKIFPYAKNGVDNGGTPANGIDKLQTNVMNFGSMRLEIDVNIYYTKPDGVDLKIVFLTPSGGTFRLRFELTAWSDEFNDKFDEGDKVFVSAKGGAFQYEGFVEWSDGQFMEMGLSVPQFGHNLLPGYFSEECLFRNQEGIASVDLKYNLSPSDKRNFSNGFDGGNMILSADITSQNNNFNMEIKTGSIKNWFLSDYTPVARRNSYLQDYVVPGYYNPLSMVQPLVFKGVPYIVPYWREDLANNYLNETIPSNYVGDKQLKMVVEVSCWKNVARTHKPFKYFLEVDSDTGWFGENGNGNPPQVELSSISYFNLSKGVNIDSLDMVDINQFTIELNRISGTFINTDNIGVSVAKKEDYDTYFQSKLDHADTYLFSSAQSPADDVVYPTPNGVGKQEITSLQSVISNAGQTVTIIGSYQATASSQARLDIGDPYLLSVSVNGETDLLVQLLADDNIYTRYTDETGLVDLVKGRVFDPDADPLDIDTDGYSDMECWVEDGLSIGLLLKQQQAQFGEIVDLEFKLLSLKDSAINGTTDFNNDEDFTVLQTYQIPFDKVSTNSDGLPIYQGSEFRDYNLDDNNPFKLVNFSTEDNGVETDLTLNVAFKVNWQYWNSLANVPDVFFNPGDAHNGYNERTSNYSEKPVGDEYNVKAVIFITYKNRLTPFNTTYAIMVPMKAYDYGEDKWTRQSDFADFTGYVFTEKMDGTDLGGSILTGEPTKILVHFVNNGRDPYNQDFWFMTRIEENEQPGNDIWEISTLKTVENENPLNPIPGELALFSYPDGANGWWTECITVPSRLDPNTGYKLSGRIGSNENGEGLGFGYTIGFTDGFDA